MTMSIRARLASATTHNTTEREIQELSREIARRARLARYPDKSVAAVAREARRAGVDDELLRQVVGGAVEFLGSEEGAEIHAPPPGRWLTPLEAAAALAVPPMWVLDRLSTPEGRRLLGYPWYDGRRWHIPAAACDSNTRTAFLASLPAAEPPENVSLLNEPR